MTVTILKGFINCLYGLNSVDILSSLVRQITVWILKSIPYVVRELRALLISILGLSGVLEFRSF